MTHTTDLAGAAALLNIDEETMRQIAAEGLVYGAKIGRGWVFLVSDVIDYLRDETRRQTECRRKPGPVVAQRVAAGKKSRRRPPPDLPEAAG